jgi:hypothetical protein
MPEHSAPTRRSVPRIRLPAQVWQSYRDLRDQLKKQPNVLTFAAHHEVYMRCV